MKYEVAVNSAIGARSTNQDRAEWSTRENAVLLVLADGLGGYEGGEVAAEAFVNSVLRSFESVLTPTIPDPHAFIVMSTLHGHRTVNRVARLKGFNEQAPRTTAVICIVQSGYAYWGHVGDSRLYHWSNDRIQSRTADHTTTEKLRKAGYISEDDMRKSANQGPLVRCVGGPRRPVVTLGTETRLESDDMLLLCSDGIWRAMEIERIYRTLRARELSAAVADLLVRSEKAMKRTCDNVTAVAFRWDDKPSIQLPLNPPNYSSTEQAQLWEDQWRQAQERRAQRHDKAKDNPNYYSDSFLLKEIEEMDQQLSEFEDYLNQFGSGSK